MLWYFFLQKEMYGEEESAVEKKIAYNETKREGNFSRNININLPDEKNCKGQN